MGPKDIPNEEAKLKLRKQILQDLSIGEIDSKREISVMTRLSTEVVELVDALVKLKLFNSRSQAAAALIMKTIITELDQFKQLKEQADKLNELEETVMGLATKALRE
ncbi:MAG: hypothetical protein ACW99G_02925 [Candidatus Thorarchaeota archaeon]|jgi:hypothetical protein